MDAGVGTTEPIRRIKKWRLGSDNAALDTNICRHEESIPVHKFSHLDMGLYGLFHIVVSKQY